MKKRGKWVVGVLVLLGVATAEILWIGHAAKASYGTHVEAEFTSLPADDRGMELWLAEQAGVVKHSVSVQRHGQRIEVMFIQVQDMFGDPPFPKIAEAAERLGYGGRVGEWRDVVGTSAKTER